MHIPRIILFAIVLLLLRVAAGFVVAAPATQEAEGELVATYVASYLLDAAVVIAVFAMLSKVQIRSIYLYGLFVILVQELLGIALLSIAGLENPQSPLWLLDWVLLMLSAILGISLGTRFRRQNQGGV